MSRRQRGSVLVVDDDRSFRELLRTVLEARGSDVVVAEDGVEALERAESRPLDAVVTDFDMPRLNGLELCRALRDQVATPEQRVPVWVVTGAVDLDRKEAIAAGAMGMFRKPCKVFEISKTIERHLGATRPLHGDSLTAPAGVRPAGPPGSANPGSAEPATIPLT